MAVQISGNDITVPRDGTFSRNVSIAGTLTYEDVTNVDSIGIVTARNGIEVGARPGVAASISCLLYTSPSPRDWTISRMPSSA